MKNTLFDRTNNYWLYAIVVLTALIPQLLFELFIPMDELIYTALSNKLAQEQVDKFFEDQASWWWLGYAATPLIVLLRAGLVAICLYIGVFMYEIHEKTKITMIKIFKITLVGEFVLLSASYVKFFYFYFQTNDYSLEDIQRFSPLSLVSLFNIEELELWLQVPLQAFNIFELIYILLLSYFLSKIIHNKFTKSFELVLVSYGSGLLVWTGLIMFLLLNIS
ncbi:MAG: hypothetical protein H6584_06445 [Flavobacteriales bacterium]|nr:hypothetical protein [Flavobacteriales bacterium]